MKKILNIPINECIKIKLTKFAEKRVKLPKLKPDTFEKTIKSVENLSNQTQNDMGGMHFQEKLYKLFPEDLEKLKRLPEEQRADFLQKLHNEGRYTRVYKDKDV